MEALRVVRYEVPERETLERLAAGPLPAGLKELHSDMDFFRDVYFDTAAGDLKVKGATARLRLHKDGTSSLLLDVLERTAEHGHVRPRSAEAPVEEGDPLVIFRGDTEPAQLLRALIDPERLQKSLELETLRRTRTAAAADGPEVTFCMDLITVHCADLTSELFELEVTMPQPGAGLLDGLIGQIREEYGLRPALAETAGRAREMIDALEVGTLTSDVRAAREVVVVAYEDGAIALLEEGGNLLIPSAPGAGKQTCRRALRGAFGNGRARIRLLGSSAGSPGRPSLQVWLAEELSPDPDATGITWVPLEQALHRAGGPGLRDARTLAALHVVARSGFANWGIEAARSRGSVNSTGPAPEPLELVLQRLEAADGTVDPSPKKVPPHLLLNMDLSRIAFDERMLVFAEDPSTPLLERVRFLGMFGERRDDFFMTRVARFKRMIAAGETNRSIDGLSPAEQLDAIAIRSRHVMNRAYYFLNHKLIQDLEAEGITIDHWEDLSPEDASYVHETYGNRLEALITPLAADPTHPFPHVRNLRPALAAVVRVPEDRSEQFVAIELPGDLPRFIQLPGGRRFVPLEDVIQASLPELYPGLEVVRAHTFRVTRSAKVDIDEESLDVLQAIEEEITRRPFQEVVRLEVEKAMPPEMRAQLLRELQFDDGDLPSTLGEQDVFTVDRLVDLAALKEIAALDLPGLKFQPIERLAPLDAERSIFEQIRERDQMVHFPRDSFEESVERLMRDAADDPDVLGVKVTVYRTSKDSGIVAALRHARDQGKDAVAMVELKASFDERRNIDWARGLEAAGIRVVFSPPRFKVHAKIALVLRREGEELRRYAYIGTGNLNAATAATYIDVGLFTADPALTQEVNTIFNLLTGYSAGAEMNHLLVAPFNMRRRFLRLIEREAEHARAGREGLIRAQLNGLADRRLISALYRASQDGVRIELMVREICSLRPGLEGVSENIRVTSLLGRFLQHARIFHFQNGGEAEYFFGSADWRPRNLLERIEAVTPVRDPEHMGRLGAILDETLSHPDGWTLGPDGAYRRGREVIGGRAAIKS